MALHLSLASSDERWFGNQVFGTDMRYWFVPAYSEEDMRKTPALQGLEYPTKPDLDAQEY